MRARKMREMTVELTPITDADVPAVAEFLCANHNDRVPWALSCSAVPWKVEAPPSRIHAPGRAGVVGTLLALYSERLVAGRVERFCNLGIVVRAARLSIPEHLAAQCAAGAGGLQLHNPVARRGAAGDPRLAQVPLLTRLRRSFPTCRGPPCRAERG